MARILSIFLPGVVALLMLAGGGIAAENPALTSGLPVPRFVTTRAEAINVRAGPGERYPVKWVLRRKGMPVEITAEYDNWRKVRDWQGTEGWVNQALLSGRRAVVVYPDDAVLRREPDAIAAPEAKLQTGVFARIKSCRTDWCRIETDGLDGWISKQSLWGVYPNETLE